MSRRRTNADLEPPVSARRRSSAFQSNTQHLQFLAQQQQQQNSKSKKISSRKEQVNNELNAGENESLLPIWPHYCVNIYQDGCRNMDKVCHIHMEHYHLHNDLSKAIEFKLRPISGIRNHLKRNLFAHHNNNSVDVIKETDLVQRISDFKDLKRLDLSFNNINAFPRQLCNLELLESLNLSNNNLQDNDFPSDVDRFQNLIELILDNNKLKKLPRSLTKFKRLQRLSIKNNYLSELKNLENFKKLKHLILDNNCISFLDDSLKPLEKLEILSLSNNQLNSLPGLLFRSTFKHLRRLDLSLNQLQTITSDLFMLPHVESINLSKNQLTRLPNLPSSYIRAYPIFSIDLSSNQITCFNDYLLMVSLHVDLSSNRIRVIPLKAFKKLTEKHFRTRSLKIDDNPLVDPPIEYCKYGLRDINEYLIDNFKRLQINKGFKIFLLGNNSSGKTALAYALEDYHTQTNLIEQMFNNPSMSNSDGDNEEDYNESTKFIDIHEFLFKSTDEDERGPQTTDTFITSPSKSTTLKDSSRTTQQSRRKSISAKSMKSSNRSESRSSRSPPKTAKSKLSSFKPADHDIDAFKIDQQPVAEKKTCMMNVHVYDMNGSLANYAHIVDLFIDKSSLIILCIDSTKFLFDNSNNLNESINEEDGSRLQKFTTSSSSCPDVLDELSIDSEKDLKGWLDLILLKLSKNTSFHIIPVLTKCDKLLKFSKKSSMNDEETGGGRIASAGTQLNNSLTSSSTSFTTNTGNSNSLVKMIASKVENLITSHINDRLNDIKVELKKIEALGDISPSQSDRLKQLVQTRANLNPNVHKSVVCISSLKMDGIDVLTNAIRDIVYNNPKQFPDVNKKVPTFWLDIEEYACNALSTMSYRKLYEEEQRPSLSSPPASASGTDTNLNALFLDYKYYRERLVEKYGMSNLIENVTKYLHSSGKIIWFSDFENLKPKVFLHPNILFNMLYVLFREDFAHNFQDQHLQIMRSRLIKNSFEMTESYLTSLQSDLLDKGRLKLDLLKLLWYPILIIDSSHSLLDLFTLFSFYFRIGYPDETKEKLKNIYAPYLVNKTAQQTYDFDEQSVYSQRQSKSSVLYSYDRMIIPHYLPYLDLDYQLKEIQTRLLEETGTALESALTVGLKKDSGEYATKISQRYEFPWGLASGLFERFATSCIITSDFYAKIHYKNLLLAYNEDNTIGTLIYFIPSNEDESLDHRSEESPNRFDHVIFEFYLISYQSLIETNVNGVFKSESIQTTIMDLDQLWSSALKILQIFEDTINHSYPSLRYDRHSQCPNCLEFSFLGEWQTPKELQKTLKKSCKMCKNQIDYIYLVKPAIGKNPALDLKKLQTRLENMAKMYSSSTNNTSSANNNTTSKQAVNNESKLNKQPKSKNPSISQ